MKIIDLLVKISKGEELPKEIMFDTDRYYLNNNNHYVRECGDFIQRLDIKYNLVGCLNDEVEIIEEEKEIEFDNFSGYTYNVGRVDESNIEKYIHTLFSQQMRLIENQKKIINVINDMRDKEC